MCDGLSRRECLRVGGLGVGSLTLPHPLEANAIASIARALACFAGMMASGFAAEPDNGAATRTAFLRSHCFACHAADAEDAGGGVRLDTLPADIGADIASADTWQKVLKAVNSGEMPPEDKPRPEPAELEAFLESLSLGLVDARRKLADAGGGATLRRLNRREYVNTIRELTGIDPDASNLPDDAGAGFYDTAGSSLMISSDQFEAYVATARSTLRAWLARDAARARATESLRQHVEPDQRGWPDLCSRLDAGEERYDKAVAFLADAGLADAQDYQFLGSGYAAHERHSFAHFLRSHTEAVRRRHAATGSYLTDYVLKAEETVSVPKEWPPGRYVIRVRGGATPDAAPSRRFVDICLNQIGTDGFEIVACRELLGTDDEPRIVEAEFTLREGGPRIVTVRERRANFFLAPIGRFYRSFDATGTAVPPSVWIDWIEVEHLPDAERLGDPAIADLFAAGVNADISGLRESLGRFASRAFRGATPADSYLDKLVAFHRLQREQGATDTDATIEAAALVLASPAFLYLVEPAAADASARRLNGRELAARLSYFLTSGPPDAALLAAAAVGELDEPAGLIRQADRLIASEKCHDFVTGFVHQWLDIDRLDFFQFDPALYWEFDDSTREAARQEIYRFFTRVLRENMSTREFLASDWTMADGLLGSYYGLEGVHGPEWRVVSLPADSHRGGLMGMAAVLAMGSNGVRTSPVERGAWVLRKLLDRPPPPAPANVPQLSRLEGELMPSRERLRMHQEAPQCVHCHKKIDPIGFGMDNFDAVGRWRGEESQTVKEKGTKSWPIDAAGTFIDGREFHSYDELKALVASCHDAFARSLTANLLEYAIGRPLGFADEPLLDAIMSQTKADGSRLADIVHAIVTSEAFRTK